VAPNPRTERTLRLQQMSERRCVSCGNYYDHSYFYKLRSSEDGLHPSCKGCCKVSRALESVRKRDKRSKISFRQYHRACKAGVEADKSVTLVKVFKRDRGICYLCELWVQPRHASMDHVTPIVRGGTHTFSNIRLTHIKCNLRKGDR
jgi:5-methylcytosine-specific restriction endonuclease McrA